MRDIRSVAPTVCALLVADAPEMCSALAFDEVLSAACAGLPLERCLIFAPDALGLHLHGVRPELFAKVEAVLPIKVPLRSMLPPVTPVCFASMFSGALPEAHGIREYVRPRLECDTMFDALLRAGKRMAIVAVEDCSVDIIFRGRELDYFSEKDDLGVVARALELIAEDRHELLLAYQQGYDDMLHVTEPLSSECMAALEQHVASFEKLNAAARRQWAGRPHVITFTPDHGAHIDPLTGHGTHGIDIPEDMELVHYWRVEV